MHGKDYVLCRYLFLVNGQGWGHAIRDRLIALYIAAQDKDAVISFASRDDGLQFFNQNNIPCFSLDAHSYDDIDHFTSPDYIICDEDFSALTHYRSCLENIVFITNYLDRMDSQILETLSKCRRILFCEYADSVKNVSIPSNVLFVGPPGLWKKTSSNSIYQSKRSTLESNHMIMITFGGSQRLSARLENYQLLCNLSKASLPDYTWVLLDKTYQISRFQWKTNVHQMSFEEGKVAFYEHCSLCITRGGWNSMWEAVLSSRKCVSIPYSDKVNPLEKQAALTMKNRDLIAEVSLDNGKSGIQQLLLRVLADSSLSIEPMKWICQQENAIGLHDALKLCFQTIRR